MDETKTRESMVENALSFRGTAYYWGGDDSFFLDCSGFIIEIDKSVGLLPHIYDNNADGLWQRFRVGLREPDEETQPGDHVFYFDDDYASHIELAINSFQVIGASGGGRPQFDLYDEMKKDNFLASHYGAFSRATFNETCLDDFMIKLLKHFLIINEAIKRNAFIKIRPRKYRANSKVCNPFAYREI